MLTTALFFAALQASRKKFYHIALKRNAERIVQSRATAFITSTTYARINIQKHVWLWVEQMLE